ncbi:unnamed protein product [Phytophthora lilii]|uniref:Unnamed protein product n=1 Tax=Phytophthora lilii TaxID=2077276 RepID=A0A9W6X086_9STRA|nr:unnamed protein product [Phytophthora lilii]
MPTEEFKTPEELKEASIADLKERLERRDVDFAGCVERRELVELLVKYRGGPSNNDTCCICCEEYQTGDALPVLLSYGDGFLGALGTGGYENVLTPTPLPTTTELSVKEISVGWAHAGFVTNECDAYIYGRTHSFRDVIRATNMQRVLPKLVWWMNSFTRARGVDTLVPALLELPEGEKVKKIVCSTALTFLLTESGKLFTLGANSYGQCGVGEEGVSVHPPTHVNIDGDEIVDIAAGYQHGLAVTKNGTVFSWGKGERGQLGFGTGNAASPQELIALKGKKIAQVGAGFNHSVAVSGDDKIWLAGRTPSGRQEKNDFAQVASEMHTTPIQITNEQVVRTKDIVKIGKGVDKSSFITGTLAAGCSVAPLKLALLY